MSTPILFPDDCEFQGAQLFNARAHVWNNTAMLLELAGMFRWNGAAARMEFCYNTNQWSKVVQEDLAATITSLLTFTRTGAPFALGPNAQGKGVAGLSAQSLYLAGALDTPIYPDQAATANTAAVRNASGQIVAASPTADNHLTTQSWVKDYVDQRSPKDSVRVVSTLNISLSGTQTIDGILLVAGDRVLVKGQTTASQNGIWTVGSGAWTRSADCDLWAELVSAYAWVDEGSANADTGWLCTVNAGGTLGTTAVTWTQVSGGAQLIAGNGIWKNNNTLAVISNDYSGHVGSLVYASGANALSFIDANGAATNKFLRTVSGGTPAYAQVDWADLSGRPTTISGYGITDANVHNSVTLGTANGLSLAGQALSLQVASNSQPGALSAADWATFNAKQSTQPDLTAIINLAAGPGLAKKLSSGSWTLDTTAYAPLANPAMTGVASVTNTAVGSTLQVINTANPSIFEIYRNQAIATNGTLIGQLLYTGKNYAGSLDAVGAVSVYSENFSGDMTSAMTFSTRKSSVGVNECMRLTSAGNLLVGTVSSVTGGRVEIRDVGTNGGASLAVTSARGNFGGSQSAYVIYATAIDGGSNPLNTYGVFVADLYNYYGLNNDQNDGATTFGIYAAGGARNYFAGKVNIGQTNGAGKLNVNGSVYATVFNGSGAGLTAATVPFASLIGAAPLASPSFSGIVSTWAGDVASLGFKLINSGTSGRSYSLVSGIRNVGQIGFSIYDETDSASRMVISGAGNVLFGYTSDSGYKVDVNGNLRAANFYGSGANLTGIPSSGVTGLDSALALLAPKANPTFSGTVTFGGARPLIYIPSLGAMRINGDAGTWGMAYGFLGNSGTDFEGFGILGTADSLLHLYIGKLNAEFIKCFSNGNVTIGPIADSGYKLDVSGTLRATTFYGAGSGLTASSVPFSALIGAAAAAHNHAGVYQPISSALTTLETTISGSGNGLLKRTGGTWGWDDPAIYALSTPVLSSANGTPTVTGAAAARKVYQVLSTSATSYTIKHGLGTDKFTAQLVHISSGARGIPSMTITDSNTIVLNFLVAPAAGAYSIVITG
jgi:hypothetical protein